MRMVVVLRDVYDLPHEEIARELGISQTAAKVRLHRARRRLREQLFPPAAAARRPPPSAPQAASAGRPGRAGGRGWRREPSRRAAKRPTGMQPRSDGPRPRAASDARAPSLARAASARGHLRRGRRRPAVHPRRRLARPPRRSSSTWARACAARRSSPGTASCCACSTSCAPHRVEPPPGAVADVLGALEDAAQRRVIRSALSGPAPRLRRALAAPAAAVVAVTVARRGRLRRGSARGAIVMPTRGDRCSVSGGPRPRPGGQ